MEEDSPIGLLDLPKRKYGLQYKFLNKPKECLSNYYQVSIGAKKPIFQMTFDSEPAIPNDSKDLLFECIRSIRKRIKENVDLIAFSGRMLWGLKELKFPLNLMSQFTFQGIKYQFEVVIKTVKKIDVADLMKTADGQAIVFQIYNNEIKQILRQRQMQELQRGKYYDKKQVQVKDVGLNILRGYKFTLCNIKSGLHLQIDVCSRVYRSANLLEQIANKKDFANQLNGSIILTNYGKRRTYKIVKINYDLNPYSQFWHDKKAGKITYAEYYQENYGLKVLSKKQPLVQVVLRTEQIYDKVTKKFFKKDVMGYLIPEFISLTGMSDQQRANYNTMKQIAPFTKLKPQERIDQTDRLVQVLNKNGRLTIGEPRRITAFQLVQPNVKILSQVLKNKGDGNMNIRSKLQSPVKIKDYVIVYSRGSRPQIDESDALKLASRLKEASGAYGVELSKQFFIQCQPNLKSWIEQIEADISENGKPQIIILYLNPFEEKFYAALKKHITCNLKLPCQAIRKKSILKAKDQLATVSKIIIQMNQKIGGTAWKVMPQQGAFTTKKSTMYGSFAISKGKNGYTLAFVGTLDSNFTKVFSYCKTGYKAKETIPQADYEDMFKNWAKNYVLKNQSGPQVIIIYREGLSEYQTRKQVYSQVNALNRVVKIIGQKTKIPDYKPEVVYITVTTKINSRFFDFQRKGDRTTNAFKLQITNPNSGTVIVDELTVNENYDFFMAAQRVNEGTCTPTHYQIVHNTSKISIESLTQFTYEQCFNYYNWTGAVKVPAAMQCANKLAKLVGQSIQSNLTEGEILKSYYFL